MVDGIYVSKVLNAPATSDEVAEEINALPWYNCKGRESYARLDDSKTTLGN